MTWLGRWRRRRALIRQAEALEADAYALAKTLPEVLAGIVGNVPVAAALLGAAAFAARHPDFEPVLAKVMADRSKETVDELRAQAWAKRQEAARL